MSKFNVDQKIGDITTSFPKVVEIFKEYRIDFCCGGDRPLKQAIKEANLNEDELITKINNLYDELKDQLNNDSIDFLSMPIDKLSEYIVNTHHAYLNVNMPKISELTKTILRVHGAHHPELAKVHKLFSMVRMELEEHLIKEETIQYPAIYDYTESLSQESLKKAINIINELQEEHVGAGDIIKELRDVTNDYSLPKDACSTYKKTYIMLQEFESDLFQHIHLESNILFPRLFALERDHD